MEKTGFTACREATYFSGRKLRSEEREMSLSSFVSIAFLDTFLVEDLIFSKRDPKSM